ncbi:MAG: hypothetical protein IPJ69_04945 [Deltaproteobacteria bacterium]|nr:MAG: hypothetical protein IPJ69_04945 [Deltaproteobacteria bacterium]
MGSVIEESMIGNCAVSFEESTDSRGKIYFSAYVNHALQGQFIIDDRDLTQLKERIISEIIPLLEVRSSL